MKVVLPQAYTIRLDLKKTTNPFLTKPTIQETFKSPEDAVMRTLMRFGEAVEEISYSSYNTNLVVYSRKGIIK